MQFELAEDQATPIEVGDRDGRPVLRLRRGAAIDERLVGELNDLVADDSAGDETAAAVVSRPPVVVVVVR